MNPLTFLETMTVEQFKDRIKATKLSIKPSVKTRDAQGKPIYYTADEVRAHIGRCFFTAGNVTGAVASKGIPAHPMVSKVQGDATDRNPSGEFYLLHEEGTGGAPEIMTF